MIILRTVPELRAVIGDWKRQNCRIGLVPTMGYLHEGHLSLVDNIHPHCDKIIVSIFVNPKQFAPTEDLNHYPRDFERDEKLLSERGVDAIFYPSAEVMYPEGYLTYVEVNELGAVLCGRSRPDHFRGVTTVVCKLFVLTKCDVAAFGQKDYQQARLIQKMVEDLNFDIKIIICPIVRESDGLAMSSRNVYLSPEERDRALCLHQALVKVRSLFASGKKNVDNLLQEMHNCISATPGVEVDYLEIVDTDTIQPVEVITKRAVAVGAIWVGKTRLIDNVILEVRGSN